MYKLTLTSSERQVINFVGDRYANGYQLFTLLLDNSVQHVTQPFSGEDWWGDNIEIIFLIPEHIAWQIKDLAEHENNLWPLFSPAFAAKMQKLVDSIV